MVTRAAAPTLVLGILAAAGRVAAQTEKPAENPAETQPEAPVTSPVANPVEEPVQGVAPPQDDSGPVIVGTPRETWSGFQLLKLRPDLEFRWRHDRDKLKVDGQQDQTTIEDRYRELLNIDAEATIGHKNLIDIVGNFQLGLEDTFTRTGIEGGSGHSSDFLGLWDVNALIFGTSELPTNIYSRRNESRLRRPFAGTIDETLTDTGVATGYRNDFFSTTLEYFHRDDQITGNFGSIDTKTIQDTFTTNSIFTLTPSQRIELNYTLDAIDESQSGGYSDSYVRHDGTLTHNWSFGEDAHPSELRSTARVYQQSGLQDLQRFRWDEFLTLRHTDRFETRHSLVFQDDDIRGSKQQLIRGDSSAKYRLFESLTSLGTVGAQRVSDGEGFTSDDLFVTGQLDYTKSVPLGRLDASAGLGFDTQSNSEQGSTFRVLDEAHVYTDGFPIVLARRNIVPGSVEVRPTTGSTPYQEGIDYTVMYFPDHTEIRGVVTGGLVSGQIVLVTYDVGPEPGSDIDTVTTSMALRYTLTEGTFKGLAGYTTYRTIDHTVRADDPSLFTLDDSRDLLVGIEYLRGEILLRTEYNIHDSTFDPYTVWRLLGRYSLLTGAGSSLSAEVSRDMIDFTDVNDNVVLDRAVLRWNTRLDQSFDMHLGLDYRHEDSSRNGTSQGLEESIGFNWRKRQTSIYATFRNSNVTGSASDQESQSAELGIRRAF